VLLPELAFVPLAGDVAAAVAQVPAVSGVGQILGPGGDNLVLGSAANLRRWAASHLGLARTSAKRRRPRTDLSGIATAVGWLEADGAFRQRLLFERLMAPLIPLHARRDLKPPAFLHLDPRERFPRVTTGLETSSGSDLYGPFRDRGAAERARDFVERRFSLRPCDFVFEPDPAAPLGLGCLYAQVRSCAAPCLGRVGEDEYRSLAARAAAWLADPAARVGESSAVPAVVSAADAGKAVVVDAGRREVGLYPVRAGRVLDSAAVVAPPAELPALVERLDWPEGEGASDWPWLASWLRSPKGRRSYVPVTGRDRAALARAVRAVLPVRFGGNVGAARGQA
jgi:hypothetical protein